MRLLARLSLLAAGLVCLAGCAFMSDEDRDFYGKGWVNPRELDQQPQHHAIPNPEAPADAVPAATTTMTHAGSDSDQWMAVWHYRAGGDGAGQGSS